MRSSRLRLLLLCFLYTKGQAGVGGESFKLSVGSVDIYNMEYADVVMWATHIGLCAIWQVVNLVLARFADAKCICLNKVRTPVHLNLGVSTQVKLWIRERACSKAGS